MPSSSFCSSQLCGLLSIVLPIIGGIFGLVGLYLLVRYWSPISSSFSRVFLGKSSPTEEMSVNRMENGVVNGGEKGVRSNAASAVGEPQTFVPNFFFLRQNSLNESSVEKKAATAAAGASSSGEQGLKGCLKKPSGAEAEGMRRLSKSHPACSPTFETDPIDWGDLGIKLPEGNQVAE